MAWRRGALAMGVWFGMACGEDPVGNGSTSSDDDGDDESESEDDDPVVDGGSSTDADESTSDVAGSSGLSTGSPSDSTAVSEPSTGTDASETDTSGTGSSSDSSSGSSDDGEDTDPTEGVLECDPFAQDCDAGEKCAAWADDGGSSWNATRCVPLADDPAQPGESCVVEGSGVSGIDDCDLGSMCWDVDPFSLMGTCVALCTGSEDDPACADAASACQISNGGVLNLCLPICNPLLDDCPAGQGCYPGDDAFSCSPDASGGAGAQFEECMFVNVCDPGLACILGDFVGCADDACCSAFCDFTDPTACTDAGLSCLPWYEEGEAPPGFEYLGICAAA